MTDQSLELFELRPRWDNPSEMFEHAFTKTTYTTKSRSWKIYWMRQDLKWHRYDPVPEVASLEELLSVVSEEALALVRLLFDRIQEQAGSAHMDIEICVYESAACHWGFCGMHGDKIKLNYAINL